MYTLHGVPDWGSQVIHMALAETGAPFRFVAHDPKAGGLKTPGFLALNPHGKVPVLETAEGPVFETAAILLALIDAHGVIGPKAGEADRARFLIWLVFIANQLHPTVMTLIHPEEVAGEALMRPVAEAAATRARAQFARLEALAGEGGPWWMDAAQPSAVSLFTLMLMRWAAGYPAFPDLAIGAAEFPALGRLARGIEARPAIARVLAAEGVEPTAFSAPDGR
jgi:glutathione S-transferase